MIAMRPFLPFAAVLLLAACSQGAPAQVDGSSPEAFDASMAEVRGQLGPADRARFSAAVQLARVEAFAKADTREEMSAHLRRKLDGKTGAEIIAEAQAKKEKVTDSAIDEVFKLKRQLGEGADELKAVRDRVADQVQ